MTQIRRSIHQLIEAWEVLKIKTMWGHWEVSPVIVFSKKFANARDRVNPDPDKRVTVELMDRGDDSR